MIIIRYCLGLRSSHFGPKLDPLGFLCCFYNQEAINVSFFCNVNYMAMHDFDQLLSLLANYD